MSKPKVHVLVPFDTVMACGVGCSSPNAMYREHVTCPRCKKTDLYKALPNLPKRKPK